MGNIQHYNALLYEKHMGLVDDLVSEGRALRREIVESCKAFAEAMPETETDELRKEAFDLFMRDVHIAHDEFQKRLGSLCDDQHASELERLNTENKELNNRIADLRGKLTKQEKDNISLSKRLNDNISLSKRLKENTAELSGKLTKQEKDNISLSKNVDKLQNKNTELKEQNAKTLEQITKLREDISKTVESFDVTLEKIDKTIESLIKNVVGSSGIFSSSKVEEEAKKFHEVYSILDNYRREHLLKYKYWREQAKVAHK